MSDAVIIQLITTGGLIVVAILGNRKLNRIGADAKATRDQAENEHAEAEYPNLRDELTATREVAKQALSESKAAKGATHGLTRQVARLVSWLEDLTTGSESTDDAIERVKTSGARALARAVEERDEKFAELREEIPRVIRDELAQHVADCPLRNPPAGT
ncbi:hypothetical protein [Cellulosimicrobium sp. 22601]|uniref:hypothetical protein n=1 Tax=unclassified Cellulosimicrobium TaxID=2624466 RepID=UPI003F8622A4